MQSVHHVWSAVCALTMSICGGAEPEHGTVCSVQFVCKGPHPDRAMGMPAALQRLTGLRAPVVSAV